jgi:hypothetical protein
MRSVATTPTALPISSRTVRQHESAINPMETSQTSLYIVRTLLFSLQRYYVLRHTIFAINVTRSRSRMIQTTTPPTPEITFCLFTSIPSSLSKKIKKSYTLVGYRSHSWTVNLIYWHQH